MVIAWMSGDMSETVVKDRAPGASSERSGALKRVLASSWRGAAAASDLGPEQRGGALEIALREASLEP